MEFNSINEVSAVLHVSKEAREEGMNYHTLEFGDETWGTIGRAEVKVFIEPRIYVNLEADTLCLLELDDYERDSSPGLEFLWRLDELVENRGRPLDHVGVPVEFVQRCLDEGGAIGELNSLIKRELLVYSTFEASPGPRNIQFTPFNPDAVDPDPALTPEDLAWRNANYLIKTRDMELGRMEEEQ
jgi:hypothetical protein